MIFIKKNYLWFLTLIFIIMWGIYSVQIRSYVYANDPILMFYDSFGNELRVFPIIAPLFVIIPSTYAIHNEIHSGYIKNCLTRMSYKKYMIKNYLICLLKATILPIFLIIFTLICCIKVKSINFGIGIEKYGYYYSPDLTLVKNITIFLIQFFISILINTIFYLNIGLISIKKNSNYLISTIVAFLSFFGLDIISECIIGGLIGSKIFKIKNVISITNLFNVWCYDSVGNMNICITYYLILTLISFFVLYFTYKSKEYLLYDTEQ